MKNRWAEYKRDSKSTTTVQWQVGNISAVTEHT